MYYPTLHLEIARYVQNAGLAGYDIPWGVSRIIGLPPSAMCKPGVLSAPPVPSRPSAPRHRQTRSRGDQVNPNANGNTKKVTPAGLFDS